MKRLSLLLVLCLMGMNLSYGQTINPKKVPELKFSELTPVNLIIDFSEAKIMGIPEHYFKGFEDLWDYRKPSLFKSFSYGINKQTSSWDNMVFGHFENADYYAVVKLMEMDEDGDAVSEARFYRKNGEEIVSITGLKSDGNGSSFWNALATQGQGVVHGSFSESILVFAEIGMYYAGLKLGETLDKKVIAWGAGR